MVDRERPGVLVFLFWCAEGGLYAVDVASVASKGSHVWSISPDATVFAGLTLMAEKNIGALLIVENDKPVGIMSERDYARKIILEGRSSRHEDSQHHDDASGLGTPVRQRRTRHGADDARAHRAPAGRRRRLVLGLVSIGDLVKAMIDQQQFTIEQLERYITT